MRREVIILIAVLLLISLSNTAQGIYNVDPGDWIPPGGPDYPPTGHCYNESGDQWLDDWIGNETPDNREIDVTVTAKGVQTCVDIIVPPGCVVNITFQWLNWSQYFDAWLEWAYAQYWWFEDWIDWDSEPTWENDTFWHNYSNWTALSHSQSLCEWNENVTCYTENDFVSEWFDWRVVANFTCGGVTYNTTCYYYFEPEFCPISYIYPPSPNGTACPCCAPMCINISNEYGHSMNVTVFRNDTMNETFYLVNKYIYVDNGTYCFCIDGHMDDMYYPMRYNTTYYWYVNFTDTVTGVSSNSSMFQFRTMEDPVLCPCGYEDIEDLIEDEDRYRNDAWIIGVVIVFFVAAMVIGKRRWK